MRKVVRLRCAKRNNQLNSLVIIKQPKMLGFPAGRARCETDMKRSLDDRMCLGAEMRQIVEAQNSPVKAAKRVRVYQR